MGLLNEVGTSQNHLHLCIRAVGLIPPVFVPSHLLSCQPPQDPTTRCREFLVNLPFQNYIVFNSCDLRGYYG